MIESSAEWRLRTDYGQVFTAVRNENGLLVKRKQKFPIRVEKNGVSVPVHRTRSGNGYISYVICYRANGVRKNLGFPSVGQARQAAKKAAGHIVSGNVQAVKRRPEDGHSYIRAAAVLKPFGVQVDSAASEYAEALKVLGQRATVLEAVRHFARTLSVIAEERTVQ